MNEPREVVEWTDERIINEITNHPKGFAAAVTMRNDLRATIDAQAQEIVTLGARIAELEGELEEAHESLLRFGDDASYDPLLDGLPGDYWEDDGDE